MFWRSKADAVEESVQPEPPTSETAAADVVPPAPEPEAIAEVTAVHDTPEEPPAMPQQVRLLAISCARRVVALSVAAVVLLGRYVIDAIRLAHALASHLAALAVCIA